mgnify:CR=1 FL=1|tara:strand:+ start:593 stop:754 length:162 start_codon:yes stop_codon:yes gene_type:complete
MLIAYLNKEMMMKNIKSIIIGFLLATCMFLMMGSSSMERGAVAWNPIYVKIVE